MPEGWNEASFILTIHTIKFSGHGDLLPQICKPCLKLSTTQDYNFHGLCRFCVLLWSRLRLSLRKLDKHTCFQKCVICGLALEHESCLFECAVLQLYKRKNIFGLSSVHVNLLKPTGHVMHQQFNIQQLYFLPTLYSCVLYLSENRQRLVRLTA